MPIKGQEYHLAQPIPRSAHPLEFLLVTASILVPQVGLREH